MSGSSDGWRWLTCLAALTLACASYSTWATTFVLPEEGSVVGEVAEVRARAEDTLLDIARRHDLGFEEIKLANPGVDPWLPGAGRRVVLPTQFILPSARRRGIVLNLAEMRVYYYPRTRRGKPATVTTHPVSIGRLDWATPVVATRIISKVKGPSWYPPPSVREEHAARGEPLPKVVPPGPDNPLGDFALRLGIRSYLIHGTNKPYGIGMRVSHGCIRMYPEDIEALFDRVPVGTAVRIINQPIKAGWRNGLLFLEVHPSTGEPSEEGKPDATESVREIVAVTPRKHSASVSWKLVDHTLARLSGIPTIVSMPDLPLTM